MMNVKDPNTSDITRTTLAVLFIGILIAASFWVMRPFITAIVWAAIIVVATWPIFLKVQSLLWNRRGLAVAVMTLALLLIIVVPLVFAIIAIADKAVDITAQVRSLSVVTFPPMPEWLNSIPVAGRMIGERWQEVAGLNREEIIARITPYAQTAGRWFAAQAGSIAAMLLQFLVTVIIAAIMYSQGETAAAGVRSFARRLAGDRGEDTAILSAKAVRGVALGIVVTAILQAGIGGIGLAVTGVPAAAFLTAVTFILCLAQIGGGPVLIPAVIWLYWKDSAVMGTVMLVFAFFALTLDNVVRPLLIKKGADLPLIMIFAGVIGGLMSFGVIGLFIGPVVLAVTFTLLQAWVVDGNEKKTACPEEK